MIFSIDCAPRDKARVLATSAADEQIEAAVDWWRKSRAAAPFLFEEELAAACDTLEQQPEIGTPYPIPEEPSLRPYLLRKTAFHLYYVYEKNLDEVRVRAVWGARRGHGPTG